MWIWNWLSSLWGDNGCLIDPWGSGCRTATANTDNGCGLDPWGRCGG